MDLAGLARVRLVSAIRLGSPNHTAKAEHTERGDEMSIGMMGSGGATHAWAPPAKAIEDALGDVSFLRATVSDPKRVIKALDDLEAALVRLRKERGETETATAAHNKAKAASEVVRDEALSARQELEREKAQLVADRKKLTEDQVHFARDQEAHTKDRHEHERQVGVLNGRIADHNGQVTSFRKEQEQFAAKQAKYAVDSKKLAEICDNFVGRVKELGAHGH